MSGILSARQLALIQNQMKRFYQSTASLLRATKSDDGQGGETLDWSGPPVGTFACEVSTATRLASGTSGGDEITWQQRIYTEMDYLLFTDVANPLGITEEDRISVNGLTLQILGLDEGQTSPYELTIRCLELK